MGDRIENPYEVLEDILAGVQKPRDLPLALLEDITEHFSGKRKIGEGGFGMVYKGVFGNENVAVKKIFINQYTVDERLFRREVEILMKINNHPNLVRFLGFCSNTARSVKEMTGSKETIYPQIIDRLLCFEYIRNGSLDKHITDEFRGLTWDTRFDIITGICEGLRYLHEDIHIIHMDLKPSNILLDDHMVPKITDFDLSRSVENKCTQGERFGTTGYWAPEYQKYGETSDRADIYSLGVIIVELVTGSKHIPDETHVLRRWRHRWNKPPTQDQLQQVIKCIRIAVSCSEQKPENRPSISDIIRDLSEIRSTNYCQMSLHLYDDILRVEPLELYIPSEHDKQTLCSVELTNDTINSIAFNIQTPSKQYNTRPDKGIVLPGHKRDVKITLQPQESATQITNSNKFVVKSTKVSESLVDEDITDHIFKSKGGKKVVDEVILMVVYEPEKDQVDLSLDRQEGVVSKESSERTMDLRLTTPQFLYFNPVDSISRNQATSLTSDRTMELATGAIGSLLPKLGEILNKCNLHKISRRDVKYVIEELSVMRTDLCNLSEVQWDNNNEQIKLVKLWASEVRELSYDIEDAVDGFLMQVEISEPASCGDGLTWLIHKMMSMFKLYQIGGTVKYIKHHVQHMSDSKGKYKVEEVVVNTVRVVASTVPTINAHHLSALAKDSNNLVGINDAIKDFTKRLRGVDGKELKVHSIFGSGGLGKTTLARAVYNQLKSSFRLTAFVPVGRNPDVKKFFYDILFELNEQRYINLKPANLDERQLIDVLTELLQNKRYLIVIDDLWDKKVWHDLMKFAFVDDKCGSKIIITTRIFEVAAAATVVYKLDPLSHGYSEELFYAALSREEGRCEYDVTDEVIEKILSKCGGVPLAIITIASLLARKQREDWPKVYNSIGFGPDVNEDADNTRKILLFSYSDLQRNLRTCLLHLSIFPEDKLIDKDMAIWLWVAEGFVHEEPGRGLFELGERYFNQLVNRCMIQLVVEPLHTMICFRIHDLVLDMICSLSKDENFVTVLETDEQYKSLKNNARRLAIQKRDIEKKDPPYCILQLRSFYAIDCLISVMPPLSRFKALRVLCMDGCRYIGDQPYHLEHIGKLLQLRYLKLEAMFIRKLPEEIGDLLFLQTLILNIGCIIELPHRVGRLRQLKCLRATCEVPDWIVNMTSLEDLSLNGDNMPLVFAQGLGKLTEIRDLHIVSDGCLSDSWSRAVVKSIENLQKLQSLNILYSCHNMWEGFVPPRHLHSMTMQLEFSSVPPWMNSTSLPRLSYLELRLHSMEERCLEILGRLPELHTLKLHSLIVHTPSGGWLTVTGSGAFPKLRQLYSPTMLRFQLGVMPRLEYLELLVNVLNLKNLNFDCDFTSMGNLPLLQKVNVIVDRWRRDDTDCEYTKRIVTAVKHAVDTHPHRRPVLLLEDHQEMLKKRY